MVTGVQPDLFSTHKSCGVYNLPSKKIVEIDEVSIMIYVSEMLKKR